MNDDVTIPSSLTVTLDQDRTIHNLTISSGGILDLNGHNLTISGSFTNNGTLIAGGGSILTTYSIASTTQTASSITATGVTLNGSITGTGGVPVTRRGFEWGTDTDYGNTTTETGTFGLGSFSAPISNLIFPTIYHYRSYVINSTGTAYGNDQTVVPAGRTFTSIQTGDYTNPVTWNRASVLTVVDSIIIANSTTVSLTGDTTVSNVTINSGGTLDLNGHTLTITGNLTDNGTLTGGNFTVAGDLALSGSLTLPNDLNVGTV